LVGNAFGELQLKLRDKYVTERIGDENSVGAAKFYRVACFKDIGGFVRGVCWDGIDGHMCRLKGWIARSIDEPELRITHLRLMGSSDQNVWTGRVRWGRGKYFMGSAPYYVAAVALYRAIERPFLLGGLESSGLRKGRSGAGTADGRSAYLRQLRRFELESLVLGKRRTVERYNERIRRQARLPCSVRRTGAAAFERIYGSRPVWDVRCINPGPASSISAKNY